MPLAIIFIVLLIIIAIFTILYFYKKIQQSIVTPTTAIDEDNTPATVIDTTKYTGWSPTTPDPDRGICSTYTFPNDNINFSKEYIDTLQPSNVGTCTDIDQAVLQKTTATCLGGGLTGSTCYNSKGQAFQVGETQTKYSQCNSIKCNGTLGNIALNFNPSSFNDTPQYVNVCIDYNPVTQQVLGNRCSPNQSTQQLRIERQDPNRAANSNGVYGKITSRVGASNGLCLTPNTVTRGSNLKFTDCATLPGAGYVWWFYPGSSNSNDITPQQIIYYPNTTGTAPDINQYNSLFAITPSTNQTSTGCFANYSVPLTIDATRTGPSTVNACWNNQTAQVLDKTLYDIIGSTPTNTLPF